MAKTIPGRRVCIESGYMYEFQGKSRWRSSKGDLWDTVVRRNMCGLPVGSRSIDGSRVSVVKVGKRYLAALPHAVRKPKRK